MCVCERVLMGSELAVSRGRPLLGSSPLSGHTLRGQIHSEEQRQRRGHEWRRCSSCLQRPPCFHTSCYIYCFSFFFFLLFSVLLKQQKAALQRFGADVTVAFTGRLLAGPERLFDYLKLWGINMLEVIFPFRYSTFPLLPLWGSAEVAVTQTRRSFFTAPARHFDRFVELDAVFPTPGVGKTLIR